VALAFRLAGFAMAARRAELDAGERIDLGVIDLRPGTELRLRVLRRDDGRPIAAAAVSCSSGAGAPIHRTLTDARGVAGFAPATSRRTARFSPSPGPASSSSSSWAPLRWPPAN
jgi:hypothetical protein